MGEAAMPRFDPIFDSICNCSCGSCLVREHWNCINPAHVAMFKRCQSADPGEGAHDHSPTEASGDRCCLCGGYADDSFHAWSRQS